MENLEQFTFEELLNQLKEVVEALESGNLQLEDSVKYYQEGIKLSAECKKRLDAAKEVVVKKVNTEKDL